MSAPSAMPADVTIEMPAPSLPPLAEAKQAPAGPAKQQAPALAALAALAETAASAQATKTKTKTKKKVQKRASRLAAALAPGAAPLPTPDLLSRAALRVELLRLFDAWDTNNDGVLSLLEIIFGLRARGFSLSPETLRDVIEAVADPRKDRFTEDAAEAHGHHFLDNESFIEVFTHAELLGELPAPDAVRVVKLMRESLASDPAFAAQLRQCRAKQTALMGQAKALGSARAGNGRATTDRISRELTNQQLKEEEKEGRRRTRRASTVHVEVYDVAENKTCRAIKRWWNAGSTKPCLAVLVWLFAAAIVFTFVNRWGFNEAFYYSVQSGLSVGFGSLSEEKITGRNAYEVCVPAGEANATARLAALVEQAQASQDAALQEVLAPFADTQELCAYEYTPNPLSLLSMMYTVLHICLGASVIGGALSLFSAMAVESSKEWYDDANSSALAKHKQAQREDLISMARRDEEGGRASSESTDAGKVSLPCASCWSSMAGSVREHPAETKAVTFMFCYAWFGAIVYAVIEDVHWIKGLYFAVAACSTAGLAGPSPTDGGSVLFVGLYTLFGVPMYAYTLGIFANGATATYIQAKAMKRRLNVISESEFAAADRLHNGGTSDTGASIDKYEFALLWFLRNQLITPDDIGAMQRDFDDLDADDNQLFDQSEMQAAMMYAKFDADGDQELTARELLPLANALQKTPALSVPGIMLLDPSVPYTEDDIKTVMRAYEDEETVKRVKVKVKVKDQASGKVVVKQKTAVHHTFTRKEYMQWWSDEFRAYRDQVGDGKAKGVHMRTLQLEAVIDMLGRGGESGGDSGAEKGAVKRDGSGV